MRALAEHYVDHRNFMACHPDMLPKLGMQFDAALSVWVLQHVMDPVKETDAIRKALKPGGSFFLVNMHERRVPTREAGWANDSLKVHEIVARSFGREPVHGLLDATAVGQRHTDNAFWAVYRR
jgi:2-polyprenyl-3-methyl-5-hydroxy-6-metoxy-1,4-benzoquinol methylase